MPATEPTTHPPAQEVRTPTAEQRWAAGGAILGGALAGLLTSGVLTGAVLASYNALGDVGRAAHIPDLPAYGLHALAVSLDGLAGVALLTLIVLQPTDPGMRRYCWLLLGGCIGVSMLANGAHAIFDDVRGHLELPVWVAFLISTVPAGSAAAALHLILLIAHHVIQRVRTLLAAPVPGRVERLSPTPVRPAQPAAAEPGPTAQSPPSPVREQPDAHDPRVLALAQDPKAGYRTVMKVTGWGRPRSVDALRAARGALPAAQPTFRPEPAGAGGGVAA